MQYLCWRASHSAGQLGRTLQLSPAAIAAAEQLAQGGVNGLDELPRRILNSSVSNGHIATITRTPRTPSCPAPLPPPPPQAHSPFDVT